MMQKVEVTRKMEESDRWMQIGKYSSIRYLMYSTLRTCTCTEYSSVVV